MDKKTARRLGLAARKKIPCDVRDEKNRIITDILVHKIEGAHCVGCYVTLNDEADTIPLIKHCFVSGIRVAVPKVTGSTLTFYEIRSFADLKEGSFHVREPLTDTVVQPEETDVIPAAPLLKEQLSKIIEEEELFKQPDLRVTDIAARLATNRTYVSAIIKSLSGDSFSTLVNGYRVRHAQKLMQEHPEMSVTEIAEESGFSSRSAFYRNFKDMTGLSPAEWKRAARESRP